MNPTRPPTKEAQPTMAHPSKGKVVLGVGLGTALLSGLFFASDGASADLAPVSMTTLGLPPQNGPVPLESTKVLPNPLTEVDLPSRQSVPEVSAEIPEVAVDRSKLPGVLTAADELLIARYGRFPVVKDLLISARLLIHAEQQLSELPLTGTGPTISEIEQRKRMVCENTVAQMRSNLVYCSQRLGRDTGDLVTTTSILEQTEWWEAAASVATKQSLADAVVPPVK